MNLFYLGLTDLENNWTKHQHLDEEGIGFRIWMKFAKKNGTQQMHDEFDPARTKVPGSDRSLTSEDFHNVETKRPLARNICLTTKNVFNDLLHATARSRLRIQFSG